MVDWNRDIAPSRVIAPVITGTISSQQTYGPYFVGDLNAIGFLLRTTAKGVYVEFSFYADQSLSQGIVTEYVQALSTTVPAVTNDTASWSIPVSGPYLFVRVTPSGVNTSFNLSMWADALPSFIYSQIAAAAAFPRSTLIINSVELGGYVVGTTVEDATIVLPGPATFFGLGPAANTDLRVYAVSYTGVEYLLSEVLGASGVQVQNLMLPPMHIRFKVTNTSGAGQFFSYSLTAKYGLL